MKIRSITAFGDFRDASAWAEAGRALRVARDGFVADGVEVQHLRAALPPMAELAASRDELRDFGIRAQDYASEAGVDYLSIGPWRPGDAPELADAIPDLLDATEKVFATVRLDDGRRISIPALRAAADCIVRNAPLREHGFGNLRFAALARVPAGVPFLPAAYAGGGAPAFALAMESADLARVCFEVDAPLDDCCRRLTAEVEAVARRLESVAARLETELGWEYGGADFSLATYPDDRNSIGATIESMGVGCIGHPGSVLGSALLTSAVQRATFRRAGFNGLFLPVLEDTVLAARAGEGELRLEHLLLYSTVCGTGLDTVPLPGDVTADDLLPYLLDLTAIALRLGKPLTARLMPMPGLDSGDRLEFEFPFFASGRVMDLQRRGGPTRLDTQEWIEPALRPHPGPAPASTS